MARKSPCLLSIWQRSDDDDHVIVMLTAGSDECDSKLLEDGGHRRSMLPYVPPIRVTAQARWLD